jgi:flavin reductase (DIM6/NTAB) family NADH-FMN oxidoreductase RutF
MAVTESLATRIGAAEFRHVMGHFATGVTVVTVQVGREFFGTTVSSFCSVSLEPPTILVCLNETSSTGAAVADARSFNVNILDSEQTEMAQRFATKDATKFDTVPFRQGRLGHPILDGALASLECRVTEIVRAATHTVFVAEVVHADAGYGEPLAYFRGRFTGLDDDGLR